MLADHDLAVFFSPAGIYGRDLCACDCAGFDEKIVEGKFVFAVGGGVEGLSELKEL